MLGAGRCRRRRREVWQALLKGEDVQSKIKGTVVDGGVGDSSMTTLTLFTIL